MLSKSLRQRVLCGLERDGARMAAGPADATAQELRTLLHRLGNQVAVAASYANMVSLEPDLSSVARSYVAQIVEMTTGAGHTLVQIQAVLNRPSERGPDAEPPSSTY